MERAVGSGNHLTYTEVHASILGAVVGLFAGYLRTIGYTNVAVALAVVFVAVALGLRAHGTLPMAEKTVRREPWYALAAFVVGGVVSLLVA